MKCIDLFAGAGGLSEGFKKAGFEVIAHVEKDAAACLTLKTRLAYDYLTDINKQDIYVDYLNKKISRDELYSKIPTQILDTVINEEISDDTIGDIFHRIDKILRGDRVHVIIGGPPCQAYSLIGRAKDPDGMKNDLRNYLYKQYLKFLVKYEPQMFVFENVEGILSSQGGKLFKTIKAEMRELGYNVGFNILNAKDFGVLQNRRRVIIIGCREELDYTYPVFHEVNTDFTIEQLFADLPKLKAGEAIEAGEYAQESNECLREMGIRNNWNVLTQHISRPNNENDLEIYRICVEAWDKENRRLKYTELPEELIKHKNTKSFLDRFKVVAYDEPCHTMVAHISKDGHYYIHPDITQNRSLSVREAARIQSFPDDFYFESSRTAAFVQIGNAVPPLMAEKMAVEIKKMIKEESTNN